MTKRKLSRKSEKIQKKKLQYWNQNQKQTGNLMPQEISKANANVQMYLKQPKGENFIQKYVSIASKTKEF